MPQRIAVLSIGLLALLLATHAPADEASVSQNAAANHEEFPEDIMQQLKERSRLYNERVANETLEESLAGMLHEHSDRINGMMLIRTRVPGDMSIYMCEPRVIKVIKGFSAADTAVKTRLLERAMTELRSYLEQREAEFQNPEKAVQSAYHGFRLFPLLFDHMDKDGESLPLFIAWYESDRRSAKAMAKSAAKHEKSPFQEEIFTDHTVNVVWAISKMAARRSEDDTARARISDLGHGSAQWEPIVEAARRTLEQ